MDTPSTQTQVQKRLVEGDKGLVGLNKHDIELIGLWMNQMPKGSGKSIKIRNPGTI